MGNGQVFYDRNLLAERKVGQDQPRPIMDASEKAFTGQEPKRFWTTRSWKPSIVKIFLATGLIQNKPLKTHLGTKSMAGWPKHDSNHF